MQEPNDDQGTLLRWEDHIEPILKHPDIHIRDKALIAVQWELRARSSELHQISFGDLEDRGDHMAVLLTHRNGRERLLTLCGSMPYLKKWIRKEHPVTELLAGDADPLKEATPDRPVWAQTHSNEIISSLQLCAVPKRACKCADVPTEFTFYDIRWSRAKLLAVQLGLRPTALRERFGCEPRERKEFVNAFEDDGLHENVRPRPPIQCPDCGEWTPRDQPCLWCGGGHE